MNEKAEAFVRGVVRESEEATTRIDRYAAVAGGCFPLSLDVYTVRIIFEEQNVPRPLSRIAPDWWDDTTLDAEIAPRPKSWPRFKDSPANSTSATMSELMSGS